MTRVLDDILLFACTAALVTGIILLILELNRYQWTMG